MFITMRVAMWLVWRRQVCLRVWLAVGLLFWDLAEGYFACWTSFFDALSFSQQNAVIRLSSAMIDELCCVAAVGTSGGGGFAL